MRGTHHPLIAPRGQFPGQEHGFLQGLRPVIEAGEYVAMAIDFHEYEGTKNNVNGADNIILQAGISADVSKLVEAVTNQFDAVWTAS